MALLDYRIRHATLTDIDALVALEQECFTSDLLSRRQFQHLLSAPSAAILIVEQHQQLLGAAVLFFRKNSKKARLYSLAVPIPYRQHGIATVLHDALLEQALARGCNSILLEVRPDNTAAIRFYQKHGYQPYGKFFAFYEDGTDALRMKKNI